MVAAIVVAILVMMWVSGSIGAFIARHPTIKMLALAFLLLIGSRWWPRRCTSRSRRATCTSPWRSRWRVELINLRVRAPPGRRAASRRTQAARRGAGGCACSRRATYTTTPITVQITSRTRWPRRGNPSSAAHAAPAMQVNHGSGVRNGRGRSGRVWRSTSTPMHTVDEGDERADRDQLAQDSDREQAADDRRRDAGDHGAAWRACGSAGAPCRRTGGSRPSRAMAKKMRACAIVMTSITEVIPAHRAELDRDAEPVQLRMLVERQRHRGGDVELLVAAPGR